MQLLVLGPDNGWHADQLRAAANQLNIDLRYAPYERLSTRFYQGHWSVFDELSDQPLEPTAVLARTIPAGTLEQITFRLAILHTWHAAGIPVFNRPRTLEIAIDKFATLAVACDAGWQVPDTEVCHHRHAAIDAFDRLGGDVVVKPLLGSEGQGVMRLRDRQLAWTALTTLERLNTILYVQRFVAPGGRDLRILVWGKHRFAVRRENPDDWRTNVSRGARSEKSDVPAELAPRIEALVDRLQLTYGAIDIAEDGDRRPYLLEVNAVPGWQGAESALHVDFARLLLEAIRDQVDAGKTK